MGVVLDIAAAETWACKVVDATRPGVAEAMGVRARTRYEAEFRPGPLLDSWLGTLREAAAPDEREAAGAAALAG
jgi:hypothetical protein